MEKSTLVIPDIPLVDISLNPKNPRKTPSGSDEKFDELVASVKEAGVIEPIIVRPGKPGARKYEIVVGHRRYLAAAKAGLETIPAIWRGLDDEQALDFMLIENLQREDLTEAEEAEGFKAYVGKHGKEGIAELAGKTGISPRYIRRRLAVLSLPGYVLEGWRNGRIQYGHLEQLLRVKESPTKVKEYFRLALADRWERQTTVEEIKHRIDEEAPELRLAYFPLELCVTCQNNSNVQRDLFGIEGPKGGRCLDPACFKKKQNDWLLAHWRESPPGKKYGTSGFRFRDNVQYNDHETIRYSFKPDEKCRACAHFLTVIDNDGQPAQGDEQECFDKACLRSRMAKRRGETASKEKTERKPGEPRVSWHGEYFRDVFFKKRLPELLTAHDPDDIQVKTLLLIAALHENHEARDDVRRLLGTKEREQDWWSESNLYSKIMELPWAKIKPLVRQVVETTIVKDHDCPGSGTFGPESRRFVSRFLGIDLSKEWTVTEEYLQKKTKAECLGFVKKFNLHRDANFRMYLQKKLKGRDVEKLKKGELVDLVLKSGVPLTGKVPDEILRVKS